MSKRFTADNDWWIILGVERAAIFADIKMAYYKLGEKYHPDKATGDLETMQLITAAWEVAKKERTESNGYANTSSDADSGSYTPPTPERVDFGKYRTNRKLAIQDSPLWNKSLSMPLAWCNVFEHFLYLPHKEIQLPVLQAISLIPTALANDCLPLVLLSGSSGSGKTRIMDLIRKLHERASIINAVSTYAAMRNLICLAKYGSISSNGIERNTIFCYDNVLDETLEDTNRYNLFLGAVDRASSKIIISGGIDQPELKFDVFGLIVMSSTLPLERDVRTYELHRRMLKVLTGQPNVEQREQILPLSKYNWETLHKLYDSFWGNEETIERYLTTYDKVEKLANKDKRLDTQQIPVLLELITTGVTCEIWDSIPQAIDNLVALIALGKADSRKSSLEDCINDFLTNHSATYGGNPADKIAATELADYLTLQVRSRLLENRDITAKGIRTIMYSHGYKLFRTAWRLTTSS